MAEALDLWKWHPGAVYGKIIGPAIASATTVAPTALIHHVTGTTAIVNITPPDTAFSGLVIFIADGIWTWTAAGNIAVLGTVTAALKVVIFVYDPATAKWYPSSVA